MNDVVLVHKTPEEYGSAFQDHLLEQYKIVRSRVVDVINDRNTQNKFLLTVLSAVLGVPILLLLKSYSCEPALSPALGLLALVFALIGAVISWHWVGWNTTFGQAIGAGYRLLKEMESHLPAQPFTLENQYREEMGKGKHQTTTEFTVLMAKMFFWGNILLATGVTVAVLYSRSISCRG